MYVNVAVGVRRLHFALTYAVPQKWHAHAQVGVRVRVRVGQKLHAGLILESADVHPGAKLIEGILDEGPCVTAEQIALAQFVARYYRAPIGECTRLILPPGSERTLALRYRVTEAGKIARVFGKAHGLDKKDSEVLALFGDREHKSEFQAKREGITKRRLQRLLEKGLLEEHDPKALKKARTQTWVTCLDLDQHEHEEISTRATALKELDDALREHVGAQPLESLKLRFKNARGKIQKLAKMKRVSLEERSFSSSILPAMKGDIVHALTCDQQGAVSEILSSENAGRAHLLEGVTGSGKTEVYLEVLQTLLDQGKGAIILVPEISLTPQLFARVQSRLGVEIALLHSGVRGADRRDAWNRLREGKARVCLGARSAIFAPVQNLGLIVVDEEHDGSLKQDDTPRYHARDVALWRGKNEGARVILGSATPSLETRHNADQKKMVHLRLRERATSQAMPTIRFVDMRERKEHAPARRKDRPISEGPRDAILSGPLREAMAKTLEQGQQVLLFLNRRGYASVILCETCGELVQCPHCTVSLTYHQHSRACLCHMCGYQTPPKNQCGACASEELVALGLGTERVEAEVAAIFPDARVARLDRDSIKSPDAVAALLAKVQRREIDIIVGTQMVAKGHDFPGIALVGVIMADIALGLPDYRAAERAFSLLTQVAGRAGRGDIPGQAIIQTFNPSHPALAFAQTHDVEGFALQEMKLRKSAGFPPFQRSALIRVEGTDAHAVSMVADRIGRIVRERARADFREGHWNILGPAPCPIEKIRDRTRFQVFVLTFNMKERANLLSALEEDVVLQTDIQRFKMRLILDVDPLRML